jgi:hypothetical protein
MPRDIPNLTFSAGCWIGAAIALLMCFPFGGW